MPLTINGSVHPDGAPLTVGGEQVSEVTVNGGVVWRNNYAPSVITDFAAIDGLEVIVMTFSDADALPIATYDLYENDVLIATNITSGYSHEVIGTYEYHVKAVNSIGSTDSNNDTGTASVAPLVAEFDVGSYFNLYGYSAIDVFYGSLVPSIFANVEIGYITVVDGLSSVSFGFIDQLQHVDEDLRMSAGGHTVYLTWEDNAYVGENLAFADYLVSISGVSTTTITIEVV